MILWRLVLEVVREKLVATSFSRTALLLLVVLARLSRALSMESRKLVAWLAWAGLARPRLSAPPVAWRRLARPLWAIR
jgi:hypothetical protein